MKLLIVPEDQTQDGFIAKPVIEAIVLDAGFAAARVDVLPEPRLRGASDALDKSLLAMIVQQNPMVDAFVLVVDQDCNRKGHVEKAAARAAEHPDRLVACVAVQELEVWMLALHKQELKSRWNVGWRAVRAECDPKEKWAEPLLQSLGAAGPGGGRKRAMRRLQGQLKGLYTSCPELRTLRSELTRVLAHR